MNPTVLTQNEIPCIEFVEEIPNRGQFNSKAVFTQIELEREFHWQEPYIAPFILEVNYSFILKPLDESSTQFLHGQNPIEILILWLSKQHHF